MINVTSEGSTSTITVFQTAYLGRTDTGEVQTEYLVQVLNLFSIENKRKCIKSRKAVLKQPK